MTEPEVETEGTEESKTYDESYVKELRGEAASYRKKLREVEKQVESLSKAQKEKEDSEKSDLERALSKVSELEKELETNRKAMSDADIKAKVLSEASKMNVVDPEAAYRLLDIEDEVDIKKSLSDLLKEKPYLVKSEEPPSPGVGGQPVKANPSTDQQWADLLKAGAKK